MPQLFMQGRFCRLNLPTPSYSSQMLALCKQLLHTNFTSQTLALDKLKLKQTKLKSQMLAFGKL